MSVYKSMYRIVFSMTVFPFLIFSLMLSNIYAGRLEKVITESLQIVAEAQVEEMNNFCSQQQDFLKLIGAMEISRAAMRGELSDDMSQYLNDILYSQVKTMDRYINSLTIIDPELRIAACSENHQGFADEGIKFLIAKVEDQPFFISDMLTDSDGNRMLVAVTRINEGGNTLGFILEEISLDFYKEIRERAELWDEATFYLLDGQQKIISAGTSEENREAFVTAPEEREDYMEKYGSINFEESPKGSFQYKINGSEYTTYYSNVEYTDWRVMLSVNMDTYQTQKTVYFLFSAFLIAMLIILSVWLSRFASNRIMHPINNISGTLKGIMQSQDYSLRVEIERQDELGTLGENINEMIGFIEEENLYKSRQQRLLQEKAEQDALTKVMNRERINQCLDEAINQHSKEGTAMAVLFVDIDCFKSFNDEYGHNVGDQALLFIASVLARTTDGTVGRVGGDEFLVIVEKEEYVQELEDCLKKLEEEAANQFIVRNSGTRLPVTCSIGAIKVDFSRTGKVTGSELINMADSAMYQVKNNGRRGHVITEYN